MELSKSLMIINTPKSCEECNLCVAVLGKHYCAAKGTNIAKGERDCSCPLVAVPDKGTNGGMIRNMSDEQLAEYLLKSCENPLFEVNEDICDDYCDKREVKCTCDEKACKKAIMKWLQQECGGSSGK